MYILSLSLAWDSHAVPQSLGQGTHKHKQPKQHNNSPTKSKIVQHPVQHNSTNHAQLMRALVSLVILAPKARCDGGSPGGIGAWCAGKIFRGVSDSDIETIGQTRSRCTLTSKGSWEFDSFGFTVFSVFSLLSMTVYDLSFQHACSEVIVEQLFIVPL